MGHESLGHCGEVDDFGLDILEVEAVHQVLHLFETRGRRIACEDFERRVHFGHERCFSARCGTGVPDF